jgi:hypothetical protein
MKVIINIDSDTIRVQILAVMKATVDASAESDMERVNQLEGVTELLDDILAQTEFARKQKEFDDKRDEIHRKEAEKEAEALHIEVEKAEEIRLAIEQEEADKQRIIDDNLNKLKLAARLPEDIKLRAYADALVAVLQPDIVDDKLSHVAAVSFERVLQVRDYINESTQKAHD